MKLPLRACYTARFMIELCMHYGHGLVRLIDLAESQGLSAGYLYQLVRRLRLAGFVKSRRGVHGGIHLAKPPEEIRLLEVVEAVEGPLSLVDCIIHPEQCLRSENCVTREIWEEMSRALGGVLSRITLADLAERQKVKTAGGACAHL